MIQEAQDLDQAHIRYVKAANGVLLRRTYSKLMDRFYKKVDDLELFSRYGVKPMRNPSYQQVKRENAAKLEQWQKEQYLAIKYIQAVKTSPRTNLLLVKLERIFERRKRPKPRRLLSTNSPLSRSRAVSVGQAQATLSQRKASIQHRNWSANLFRANRNLEHKPANLLNPHQFGNQSRVPLREDVVQALTTVQVRFQHTLFILNDGCPESINDSNLVDDGEAGIVLPDGTVNLAAKNGDELST